MNPALPQYKVSATQTRWLALGGVIGPVLFVTLVIVNGVLWEGYSHAGQAISELGGEGAPYPLLQSANFIILGILVVGFARALAVLVPGSGRVAVLIAIFGVSSCIANGLLPCDEACRGETTIGLLHNITGLLGFVAAMAGMVLFGRRWIRLPDWRPLGVFTLAAAAVGAVGLIVFIAASAIEAEGIRGIPQRVFVGALLLWIATIATRLYRSQSGVGPR